MRERVNDIIVTIHSREFQSYRLHVNTEQLCLYGRQLQVPQCTFVTPMRPDMVSESEHNVYCIDLTISFEDAIVETCERKTLKYTGLVAKRCCQAHTRPVEIGVRG